MPIVILLVIVAVVVMFVWTLYNGLVTAKARIDEAWSGIDVQLKRRTDLIPNLVETVKGYATHEKSVFEDVTKARAAIMDAKGPVEAADANNMLSGALKSLFAVAENYPDLKANQNFLDLQGQLSDTEDKIAYSRQFYNSNVLDYNTKIKLFPNVILAGMFGFNAVEYFKATDEDKQEVKVKF